MVLGILQARMSSTRLPGKVLKDVHGQPMILRHMERLQRSQLLEKVIVATSVASTDDALVEVLQNSGVEVRRGPLDDVASRFLGVVNEFNPTTFVRLTADCPLADPHVIDLVIEQHLTSGADYSTVGMTRTFPHGHDVEAVQTDAFLRLMAMPLTTAEREHVTMGIYNRPTEFSIIEVVQKVNLSDLRWTVDEPEDLDFVRLIYNSLYDENSSFTTGDVLQYLEQNPESSRTTEIYLQQLEARKS